MKQSVNASRSARVPTPDGSGQAMHPDVLYVAEGYQGYSYWMACTPYPFGADQHENPVIRVSDDGLEWKVFPGAPDPLVDAPADPKWHHADTDLVLHDGILYVFYITTLCEGSQTVFSVTTSSDGKIWTAPAEIYRGDWGVSPAVCVDSQGRWLMWFVYLDTHDPLAQSSLFRRTGGSALSFGEPLRCQLDIPGHKLWHIDVIRTDEGYEALAAAFPSKADPSVCRLFWVSSSDGIVWTLRHPEPILRPSFAGWDNRMIYRSTFLKRVDGGYRVWYSAASWGMRCGIGYMEGAMQNLHPRENYAGSDIRLPVKMREDVIGLAKFAAARLLPPRAYAWLVALKRRLRQSTRAAR